MLCCSLPLITHCLSLVMCIIFSFFFPHRSLPSFPLCLSLPHVSTLTLTTTTTGLSYVVAQIPPPSSCNDYFVFGFENPDNESLINLMIAMNVWVQMEERKWQLRIANMLTKALPCEKFKCCLKMLNVTYVE